MKNDNSKPTHLNGIVKSDDLIEIEATVENKFKKDHPILYIFLGILAFIVGYIGIDILI